MDLNISTNSKDHQTDKYFKSETSESLIIRRGKTFDITIEFDREYDSGKDDLKLVFLAGMYKFIIMFLLKDTLYYILILYMS